MIYKLLNHATPCKSLSSFQNPILIYARLHPGSYESLRQDSATWANKVRSPKNWNWGDQSRCKTSSNSTNHDKKCTATSSGELLPVRVHCNGKKIVQNAIECAEAGNRPTPTIRWDDLGTSGQQEQKKTNNNLNKTTTTPKGGNSIPAQVNPDLQGVTVSKMLPSDDRRMRGKVVVIMASG